MPEAKHEGQAGLLRSIASLKLRDASTIFEMLRSEIISNPIDDRNYLMERAIQLASDLPLGSAAGECITGNLRNLLWDDLAHPPRLSLPKEDMFRKADGSNNNLHNPLLGAADTPYARSVTSLTPQKRTLPDPEILFDTLLARKQFRPHPNKISSLLFYLASVITHDIFNTDPVDGAVNLNSSYLDLSPLYGRNQAEQDLMRTFHDGKLKPDCFADKRLLAQPPGVGVLLIMFNRWHDHVVEQLASINENGRFDKPAPDDKVALRRYDEDLFQTGRLITCNLYCNIIVRDYVRTILDLIRTDSLWTLDPRAVSVDSIGVHSNFASGNQVSAEFNLVYRWHSVLSAKDEKMVKNQLNKLFPDRDPDDINWRELLHALKNNDAKVVEDPLQRPFAGLCRDPGGKFSDNALASILSSSIEDVAGAFGPNHIPRCMRAIEILGIMRARNWQLATLNELRAHFKLKKHSTFEDINPDPIISQVLKELYGHPDQVELYPGVLVEDAKVAMTPGSGLCTTFTISRAILADAVALVRGDRFYTIDCTPRNLTNWGFNVSSPDIDIDNGHVIYKLILQAFPAEFKDNSIYAHFPFVVPAENEVIHTELQINRGYDYGKPEVVSQAILVTSHAPAKYILEHSQSFQLCWRRKLLTMSTVGSISRDILYSPGSSHTLDGFLSSIEWRKAIAKYYDHSVHQLLIKHSTKLSERCSVDLVRDVINLANARLVAEMFGLNSVGDRTDHETYDMAASIAAYVMNEDDSSEAFASRIVITGKVNDLASKLEQSISNRLKSTSWLGSWYSKRQKSELSDLTTKLLDHLQAGGSSVADMVRSHILPMVISITVLQSQAMSKVVDFYLQTDNKPHWDKIVTLSSSNASEADDTLQQYILEALRLQSNKCVYFNVLESTAIPEDCTWRPIPAGSKLSVDLSKVDHDPTIFGDPAHLKPLRPLRSYLLADTSKDFTFPREWYLTALISVLKVFASLKGLCNVNGPAGILGRVKSNAGMTGSYLNEDWIPVSFPTSMRVEWDVEEESKDREWEWTML